MKKVIKEFYDEERYESALKAEARIMIAHKRWDSPAFFNGELTENEFKILREKIKRQDFLLKKEEFLFQKITLDRDNHVVFIVSDFDGRNFQHFKAEDCTLVEVGESNNLSNENDHKIELKNE